MAWIEIQFGLDRSHTERYRGGEIPLILDPQARDTPVIQHTPLIPAIRHLGTRAARHTPPILLKIAFRVTPVAAGTAFRLSRELAPICMWRLRSGFLAMGYRRTSIKSLGGIHE